MIEIIRQPAAMRTRAREVRREGKSIAMVPTMGSLHEGHLALLHEAKRRADFVVLTVFVNPRQFDRADDLQGYPRDESGDLRKAEACGVDLAYCPPVDAMYPPEYQTTISVVHLSEPLCGASRPGHFDGVATIVTKLLHTVVPNVAVFGEKDYQQLAIIRRLVRDLDFDVEIVGVPTVREADGLALSSRNAALTAEQRSEALVLHRALRRAQEIFVEGNLRVSSIRVQTRAMIERSPLAQVDYVDVVDAETLAPIETITHPALVALAVSFGNTRLIDSTVLLP